MKLQFVHKHFWKFLVFCFVGGSSALVHMLFFNFFRFWIKTSFILSLIFATLFAITYNFSMNRNLTFSARGDSIKKQLPKYLLVYIISISINFVAAVTLKSFLGEGILRENIATVFGIFISIPFSFLGSLFWAFKKNPPPPIIPEII